MYGKRGVRACPISFPHFFLNISIALSRLRYMRLNEEVSFEISSLPTTCNSPRPRSPLLTSSAQAESWATGRMTIMIMAAFRMRNVNAATIPIVVRSGIKARQVISIGTERGTHTILTAAISSTFQLKPWLPYCLTIAGGAFSGLSWQAMQDLSILIGRARYRILPTEDT
jgi:hypothetical protein